MSDSSKSGKGGAVARSMMAQIKDVLAQAHKHGNELQSLAENVAKQHKASTTPLNYKTEQSIERKVNEEKGLRPSDLQDVARTTIIADKSQIPDIVKALERDASHSRTKRQVLTQAEKDYEISLGRNAAVLGTGYTGTIVNVKYADGFKAEIQVNTPYMIYAKESLKNAKAILGTETVKKIFKETKQPAGWGHKLYENIRESHEKIGGRTVKDKDGNYVAVKDEKAYATRNGKLVKNKRRGVEKQQSKGYYDIFRK